MIQPIGFEAQSRHPRKKLKEEVPRQAGGTSVTRVPYRGGDGGGFWRQQWSQKRFA
jgi:hypothetical protein